MIYSKGVRQKVAIVAVIFIGLLLLGWTFNKPNTNKHSKPIDISGAAPPKEAVSVATLYLQAREDSLGADQTNTSSWLNSVKTITTSSWYSQLQPPSSPSAGGLPYNFTVAHTNNYIIKATISDCIWNRDVIQPTVNSGVISCAVYDNTYSSGQLVQATDLPYGWTATGQQPAAVLKIVLQNGKWLIDQDLSGSGA